jgi:hypothetical protein
MYNLFLSEKVRFSEILQALKIKIWKRYTFLISRGDLKISMCVLGRLRLARIVEIQT